MSIATIHNLEDHRLQPRSGSRLCSNREAPPRGPCDLPFREVVSSCQRQDLEDARAYLEHTVGRRWGGLPDPSWETSPRSNPGRWCGLSGMFLECLRRNSFGEAFPALAVLVRRLGALGACLVEVQESREAVILGMSGQLELTLLDELTLLASWRREVFLSESRATGFMSPALSGSLGLVITGEFEGRRESEPLLRSLLTLYQCLRPRRGAKPHPQAASTGFDLGLHGVVEVEDDTRHGPRAELKLGDSYPGQR